MTNDLTLADQLTVLDGTNTLRQYWHPVAAVSELDHGVIRATLLGEDLAIYRSGGEIVVLRDLCVHRGSRLSMGTVEPNGCIRCPYHGWEYDTEGKCTFIPSQPADQQRIPSKATVAKYQAQERYGLLYVALDEPVAPIPEFPEFYDDEFDVIATGSWIWECSVARFVENAIDTSHLGVVHEGLILSRDELVVEPFKMKDDDHGFSFTWDRVNSDSGLFGADNETVRQETWVELPFSWRAKFTGSTLATAIFVAIQPMDMKRFRLWEFVAQKGERGQTDEELIASHILILEQDRAIVENQRPELLPLDITAELHVREADIPAIEYRRRLGKIVDGPWI